MERPYRVAIVLGSWTMILGLLIAVVVPIVGSYVMLSDLKFDENGASLGAAMSMSSTLSNWSAFIGLGMLLIGGISLAVTLSRWFLRHEESANPTI